MNPLKKLFNIGLCASISNLSINNKRMGGMNKAIVLCKVSDDFGKFYVSAFTHSGDHVFSDVFKLWQSRKFKTKDEATGHLTKEVRLAQKQFPWIIIFKEIDLIRKESEEIDESTGEKIIVIESETLIFDEFVNGDWVRSTKEWDWDPFSTMRDKINEHG